MPDLQSPSPREQQQPPPSKMQRIQTYRRQQSAVNPPFAGRVGGNLEFIVDREDPQNASLLKKVPDAAPNLSLRESLDLRGFGQVELYKAAMIEGIGTLFIVYLSSWNSLSPAGIPAPPDPVSGVYSTAAFLAPLVAGVTDAILLALLIYCFGAASGAHLNPLITVGTFFARLTSLPRMVLYVGFQLAGATLAGLLIRASISTRDFKVGGCFLYTSMVTISSAFTVEFVACVIMLFLAFGVGLDPRQKEIFGPALAPILVGLSSGTMIFSTAFSRPGYGGASMNPARCFGVFVGSHFPGWHWIHWVAPLAASMFHGVIYYIAPPTPLQEKAAAAMERNRKDGQNV